MLFICLSEELKVEMLKDRYMNTVRICWRIINMGVIVSPIGLMGPTPYLDYSQFVSNTRFVY